MPIDSECHKKLKTIGLPMQVDLLDKDEKTIIGRAEIDIYGKAKDLTSGKVYDHPSASRQALIAKNTSTYKYFVYSSANPKTRSNSTCFGQTLHQLGIHR